MRTRLQMAEKMRKMSLETQTPLGDTWGGGGRLSISSKLRWTRRAAGMAALRKMNERAQSDDVEQDHDDGKEERRA
jgi:hypothetical protein